MTPRPARQREQRQRRPGQCLGDTARLPPTQRRLRHVRPHRQIPHAQPCRDPQPPQIKEAAAGAQEVRRPDLKNRRDPKEDLRPWTRRPKLPPRNTLPTSHADQAGQLMLGQTSPHAGGA